MLRFMSAAVSGIFHVQGRYSTVFSLRRFMRASSHRESGGVSSAASLFTLSGIVHLAYAGGIENSAKSQDEFQWRRKKIFAAGQFSKAE
jgi:hypothetical protein